MTSGAWRAVRVPSSGMETWKSDRTSSSSASVSTSSRSTSSISSSTGSGARIAASSGRSSRKSSVKMFASVSSQECPVVRLDAQQLLLVVPLIQRLGLVKALVALQPQQPGSGQRRRRLRQLGLADPGGAFDQQRLVQAVGEEQNVGDEVVGDVAGFAQALPDRPDVTEAVAHCAYQSGTGASTLIHTDLALVYSAIAANPISRP